VIWCLILNNMCLYQAKFKYNSTASVMSRSKSSLKKKNNVLRFYIKKIVFVLSRGTYLWYDDTYFNKISIN